MDTVGRVLLTLLIPVLWGTLSAWVFDQVRARCDRNDEDERGHRKDRAQ